MRRVGCSCGLEYQEVVLLMISSYLDILRSEVYDTYCL